MSTNTVSETFKAIPVMLVELTGFYYNGNRKAPDLSPGM